jgi:DNA modification methylase
VSVRILVGDCRETLRTLADCSVQTCVTSPPYFGLRDYGCGGQIGLEQTPEAFVAELVAVFREVRRVLRDDGTLWLNLGDSYAAQRGGSHQPAETLAGGRGGKTVEGDRVNRDRHDGYNPTRNAGAIGLKHKDLIGIPWRVAFALQQPYYTGKVSDERDRVWLAAMVDAEGSICGTEYQTGDRTKTNLFISITNTSVPIIEKCERLFPQDVKHVYEKGGPSNRICYRWDVERIETKALFIREIFPHLVAKRKQAIVGYTFLDLQRGLESKKKGYLPEQQERRSWLMATLARLNAGEDVDLPAWVIEPPSLFEPGFYLRQDIIWSKPNPMPESVRDRCTKAHEYLFLLSKAPRYYFDQDAILEPASPNTHARLSQDVQNQIGSMRANGGAKTNGPVRAVGRGANARPRKAVPNGAGMVKNNESFDAAMAIMPTHRNKRSVWTVPTMPFKDAHFATFPCDLIEPCILAGAPAGGLVLDPFGGAGTTGLVADRLGRDAVLCELNPEYAEMARDRIHNDAPLFSAVVP